MATEAEIIKLDALGAGMCRWPEGEPGTDTFRFCGRPANGQTLLRRALRKGLRQKQHEPEGRHQAEIQPLFNVQRKFVAVRSALPAHSGNSFTFIRPIVGSPGFPVPVIPAFSKRGELPITVPGSLPIPVASLAYSRTPALEAASSAWRRTP